MINENTLDKLSDDILYMYFGSRDFTDKDGKTKDKHVRFSALSQDWRQDYRLAGQGVADPAFITAAKLLTTLGGLGNRSRRCWGSLGGKLGGVEQDGQTISTLTAEEALRLLEKHPGHAVEALYQIPVVVTGDNIGWEQCVIKATAIMRKLRMSLARSDRASLALLGFPMKGTGNPYGDKNRVASRLLFHISRMEADSGIVWALELVLLKSSFAIPSQPLSRIRHALLTETLADLMRGERASPLI